MRVVYLIKLTAPWVCLCSRPHVKCPRYFYRNKPWRGHGVAHMTLARNARYSMPTEARPRGIVRSTRRTVSWASWQGVAHTPPAHGTSASLSKAAGRRPTTNNTLRAMQKMSLARAAYMNLATRDQGLRLTARPRRIVSCVLPVVRWTSAAGYAHMSLAMHWRP